MGATQRSGFMARSPVPAPLGARASRPLEQLWAFGPLRAGRPRSRGCLVREVGIAIRRKALR